MLVSSPFPANHGTPGSIREMIEALADRGHEIHVVTYHFGEDIPTRGMQLHRIPALTGESTVVVGPTIRRPLYDLLLVFKALEVIARYQPDIIQAHNYEAALAAAICKLLTGVPVVYNAHNTMADELASYDRLRPKWLARGLGRLLDTFVPPLADTCLPHGIGIAQFLQDMGLGARTAPVLKVGIDVDYIAQGNGAGIRERYGLGDGPVILYAGVVDEFQRIEVLLDAMVLVRRGAPDAKLLLVQTIPNARQIAAIRRQAEQLDLGAAMVLTEPQPLAAVRDFLKAADVAVSPRPGCPGLPFKLLNYMAARRPTVLFASSAVPGLVHRDNTMLAAPDSTQAFAEAILEVLRDGALGRRLSERGYHFVREHHDRQVTAAQVVDTFYQTLAKTGHLGTALRRRRKA
jgi:glycosyltransferase involved in cell wall biosynthesis